MLLQLWDICFIEKSSNLDENHIKEHVTRQIVEIFTIGYHLLMFLAYLGKIDFPFIVRKLYPTFIAQIMK